MRPNASVAALTVPNRRLSSRASPVTVTAVCSERLSLAFQCVEAFLATGGEDEPGAFAGQCASAGLSDTGARPGDECYLSLEFVCHIFLVLVTVETLLSF